MSKMALNNKLIAKNTLLLYFRMIVIMLVSLYTSRVILNTLGVDDYGIYNVVGGVVAMFSFLNGAMTGVTQRYITYTLGGNDRKRLCEVFNTSLQIHFVLAIIIFLLAETLGLWFLNTKLNIPIHRHGDAFWIYQCSILSSIVLILSIPYNALIIAHERMQAFAYISIVEVFLKLSIAFLLSIAPCSKVVFYSLLLLLVQICIRFIYSTYSQRNFSECRIIRFKDKKLFREMLTFAAWNLWGGIATITCTQGLNILLNLFFAPVINAARAISVQVQQAVLQFATNFQTAVNPQITKLYAQGNLRPMYVLVCQSSKLSFILLFIVILPIFLEAEYILQTWLKIVPEYTCVFLRIMLCITIVDSVANPLMTAAQASGKIRLYQIVVGGAQLLVLPFSFLVLEYGFSPSSVFVVHLLMCLVMFFVRLIIVHSLIKLPYMMYFTRVLFRCFIVMSLSSLIPIFLRLSFTDSNFTNFLVVSISAIISVITFAYLFGLNVSEKTYVLAKVKSFF